MGRRGVKPSKRPRARWDVVGVASVAKSLILEFPTCDDDALALEGFATVTAACGEHVAEHGLRLLDPVLRVLGHFFSGSDLYWDFRLSAGYPTTIDMMMMMMI